MSLKRRAFSSMPGPGSEECSVNVEANREGRKGKREEKREGEQKKKWEDENEHNPVTGRKCPCVSGLVLSLTPLLSKGRPLLSQNLSINGCTFLEPHWMSFLWLL